MVDSPTLKQHVALILALLRTSPNKEFTHLFKLTRMLVSNTNLHRITGEDIEYFTTFKQRNIRPDLESYYYDCSIKTCIANRTMRWFVEVELASFIQSHIRISTKGINMNPITIESLENLL